MTKLKDLNIKVLATTIKNALEFQPRALWEKIIAEIIKDQLTGAEFVAYFDGSAKPNPGEMKIGGRILTPGARNVIDEYSMDLGNGTNNEAEYLSLIQVTEMLADLKATTVTIYGDSKLAVNQVNGLWKARDSRMRLFKERTLNILKRIPTWKLVHITRDKNMEADLLTR